ncbi:hypothetical protein B0H16DRAFT_1461946 [Mycena metata]|uniref:Uncharacterized protein n=1 Tax=Mycena metata TaxID=1033252 RepID=A0AAD7IPR1_9AGAR|nr:hypothetical protein B0H16DRAFT_1461946 [Mycena metata]
MSRLDRQKIFDELFMEREVLGKAIASLNTARRKGNINKLRSKVRIKNCPSARRRQNSDKISVAAATKSSDKIIKTGQISIRPTSDKQGSYEENGGILMGSEKTTVRRTRADTGWQRFGHVWNKYEQRSRSMCSRSTGRAAGT